MLATHKVGRRARTLSVPVNERFAEINNSIATLTGRVHDMEKHLEELKSMGDSEELRGGRGANDGKLRGG